MDFKKKKGQGIIPPPGLTPARLIAAVDLGTQETTYLGNKRSVRQLWLDWELFGAQHVFDPNKGPQNFTVNQSYTMSLGKKAGLLKMLNGWRGTAMTAEQMETFHPFKLMNYHCQINIVHAADEQDATIIYGNIGGVMGLQPAPTQQATNPLCGLDIDGNGFFGMAASVMGADDKPIVNLTLPQVLAKMKETSIYGWVADKVMSSPEYKAKFASAGSVTGSPTGQPAAAAVQQPAVTAPPF